MHIPNTIVGPKEIRFCNLI